MVYTVLLNVGFDVESFHSYLRLSREKKNVYNLSFIQRDFVPNAAKFGCFAIKLSEIKPQESYGQFSSVHNLKRFKSARVMIGYDIQEDLRAPFSGFAVSSSRKCTRFFHLPFLQCKCLFAAR